MSVEFWAAVDNAEVWAAAVLLAIWILGLYGLYGLVWLVLRKRTG